MKNVLVGMLLASVFIVPAQADNNSRHHGSSGGSGAGTGSATAPSASSTSTANGGAGGAGGNGTGGAATGGSATGGNATGGAATGGRSNANGNTSTVSVSLTNSGSSGSSSGSDPNAATTVRYDGSYTVKSAPPIAAPSLTSTFSDTCMGSSSFGLSFVGFGATGGSTMVDEACVRRLDSREFRAMGLNDVALALLCQSAANKKAVEATGRACPTATSNDTASAKSSATLASLNNQSPVDQQASLNVIPETPMPAAAPQAPQPPQAPPAVEVPQQAMSTASVATPEPVPAQASAEAIDITPLSDEAGGK